MKAKTIDCPDRSFDCDPFQFQRPLDAGNKIPSLDSLYEQLKAFAASTPPPTPTGSSLCRSSGRVENQLAADLAAAALEIVANSPLARSRSATFSGDASPFAFNGRLKVFIESAAMLMQIGRCTGPQGIVDHVKRQWCALVIHYPARHFGPTARGR